ncbi:hypothetical protein [Capillimicrobium parvum]|uniref:hypothetical protein n=1 Tax=Capillimicrobium parvum TaxID=2884022 RepID=UPI00216B5299|nr:hypothetical protein [Capillimicrobium parvum]
MIVIVLIGVPEAFFTGRLLAVCEASPDSAGAVAVVLALVPALVAALVLALVLVELFEPQAATPASNAQPASTATRTRDQRLRAWSSFMTDLLLPPGISTLCRGKRKDGLTVLGTVRRTAFGESPTA